MTCQMQYKHFELRFKNFKPIFDFYSMFQSISLGFHFQNTRFEKLNY